MIKCNYRPELSYQELKEKFGDNSEAIRDWFLKTEPFDKRKEILLDSISNFEEANTLEASYLYNSIKSLLNCTSIKEATQIAKTLRNSVSLLKLSDEIGIKNVSSKVVRENSDLLFQFTSAELRKQSTLLSKVLGENYLKA